MTLQVDRLSDALGGEINGIELRPDCGDDLIADIRAALLEHQVLVFRGQSLSPEQQVGFSRRFGDLVVRISGEFLHPEYPEVLVLSNRVVDGGAEGASIAYAGQFWHSDLTYAARPSMGSMLHALEVAEEGGDTAWANMYMAYDALSADTRARIDGLSAVHVRDRRKNPRTPLDDKFDRDVNAYYAIEVPDSLHPMVRTHPETGRRALYVSPRFTVAIDGMDNALAQPLLDELFEHQIRPEFIYRHKWRQGDLVFWDNTSTIHLACGGIEPPGIRHLHRTSIAGGVPV